MSSSASPAFERTESRSARSQSPADAAQWPFERFPPPPPDGNWLPRLAPPPPSKFPSPFPVELSRRALDPPIMQLTYPPPLPLAEEDPVWLNQMLGDLMRQRSHLHTRLADLQADVANAYVDSGLADTELDQERATAQTLLDMVGSVGGPGLVRRLLEDVEISVEAMSMPVVDEDDDDDDDDDDAAGSPSGSPRSAHEGEPAV